MSAAKKPSGIILDELDPDVRPQDDLFRHVNGKWIERTEIPADKARYGSFIVLYEEAEQAVREIIEEAQQAEPGTEARKVGDLYASFMDEERVELLGATPIAGAARRGVAAGHRRPAARRGGPARATGRVGLRAALRRQRPRRPRALPRVRRAGRHRAARRELLPRGAVRRPIREKYHAHLERMFGLAKLDDPAARARRVFDLETEIAGEPLDQRRFARQPEDLQPEALGGCRGRGIPATSTCGATRWACPPGRSTNSSFASPSFVEGVGRLLTDDRLPAWRDWLAWQVVRSSAAYLSTRLRRGELRLLRPHAHRHARAARAVEARRLVRRGRAGRGRRPHLRRAALPAGGEGGDGRARREPRRGLPPVDLRPRLDGRGDAGAALDKLEKFTPKIGYPVKWRDYSTLEVSTPTTSSATCARREFEFQRASSARSASRSTATSGS